VSSRAERASATAAIAAFAWDLQARDLPGPVREHARQCILDALGCGLAGAHVPWVKTVADFAETIGHGEVRLWGRRGRGQRMYAALANGTAVSALELEDTHGASIQHLGPTVLPAALAAAECVERRVTGEELLTAVVAGYEISVRAGLVVSPSAAIRGFHPSGLCGPFGAAAAAGKLLGLSREQLHHALGIAGSLGSGLQGIDSDALMKRMQPGHAARSGVFAAMLAQRGITGMREVLDDVEYGLFGRAVADECRFEKLSHDLGTTFEMLDIGFKIYPSCRSSHTAIDAVKAILATHPGLDPGDVESVRVWTSSVTHRLCQPRRWDSVTAAQPSIPYCVAVCLVDGDVGLQQFSETRLHDPRVARLADRVEMIPDAEIDGRGAAARWNVRVRVTARGRRYEAERDQPSGSPQYPLSVKDLREKFFRLTVEAYGEDSMTQLVAQLQDLEGVPDVRTLGIDGL
jgi:aconitate decarboxylase